MAIINNLREASNRLPSLVDPSYNFAISQVFSPALLKGINNINHHNNIRELLIDSGVYPKRTKWNFLKGLEIAYSYLKENYRCEYVYKNEIANQLLLNFHSNNSATLLRELKSDNSIADIVIINGRTSAYEIKTELDNLERLPHQIQSYSSLYDLVYIVSYSGLVNKLKDALEGTAGIIAMDSNGILKKIKPSPNYTHIFSPEKAGLTLRQSELVKAYKEIEGKIPSMGTAQIHLYCYDWFTQLDPLKARKIFMAALKSRKPLPYQFQLIKDCIPPLKMLFLGKSLTKKDCDSIKNRLNLLS